MTLCGVLKNILLVLASVLIWGTIITPLQILGYGIALAGLVYYGVGYEGIQTYLAISQRYMLRAWEGDVKGGQRGGVLRKVIIVSVFMCVVLVSAGGVMVHTGSTPSWMMEFKKGLFDLDS
jgi:hypothetical protein